jgi:hypothetical protein
MSLSACEKCWDVPCECGYQYRNSSVEWLTRMRDLFQGLLDKKSCEPLKSQYVFQEAQPAILSVPQTHEKGTKTLNE